MRRTRRTDRIPWGSLGSLRRIERVRIVVGDRRAIAYVTAVVHRYPKGAADLAGDRQPSGRGGCTGVLRGSRALSGDVQRLLGDELPASRRP
jgi:hypothetical protein